jgi:hypothetical protein
MAETLAFALVGVGFILNIGVLVMGVRAALRGKQTEGIRNALFASFGVMMAGLALLSWNTGLIVGQAVAILVLLTAAAVIVLPPARQRMR